jgi:hypothetical protein
MFGDYWIVFDLIQSKQIKYQAQAKDSLSLSIEVIRFYKFENI